MVESDQQRGDSKIVLIICQLFVCELSVGSCKNFELMNEIQG